jgi:hypothetical protein
MSCLYTYACIAPLVHYIRGLDARRHFEWKFGKASTCTAVSGVYCLSVRITSPYTDHAGRAKTNGQRGKKNCPSFTVFAPLVFTSSSRLFFLYPYRPSRSSQPRTHNVRASTAGSGWWCQFFICPREPQTFVFLSVSPTLGPRAIGRAKNEIIIVVRGPRVGRAYNVFWCASACARMKCIRGAIYSHCTHIIKVQTCIFEWKRFDIIFKLSFKIKMM